MKKAYGYIYDKQGNLKEIFAPFTVNTSYLNDIDRGATYSTTTLTPIKKHSKTKTGKLHSSVGFSIGEQTKY